MNNQVTSLSQYCFQLLLIHDCVIIPGFGGFVAHYKASWYSEQDEKFFPPSREIAFNRSISRDDGLLAYHVSVIESVSFNEARVLVKKMTETLDSELSAIRKLEFKGLGTFNLLKGNELFFTPFNEGLSFLNAYGFYPVSLTALRSVENLRQVKELVSKSPRLIQAIAGVAVLIALTFTPISITRQSLVNQQRASFEIPHQQKTYEADTKDSISRILDEMTDKKNALAFFDESAVKNNKVVLDTIPAIKKEATKELVPKENPCPEKMSQPGFYLIAGSFVEMWRVENFVKEIKTKGFVPSLIESDGKLRISVAFAGERSEAEKNLVTFRDAHPEMSFWLLSKK